MSLSKDRQGFFDFLGGLVDFVHAGHALRERNQFSYTVDVASVNQMANFIKIAMIYFSEAVRVQFRNTYIYLLNVALNVFAIY